MAKVQVIGLPGTGKTTAVQSFIDTHYNQNIKHIDIAHYNGPRRHLRFIDDVSKGTPNLIAESATGYEIKGCPIILFDIPIQQVYRNLMNRGETPDEDYLSLLAGQIMVPTYTIKSEEEFHSLLELILI